MKLIIAADDFGFSEAFSIGVVKACKEGVATVAGLMPNMAAAPFAVELLRRELPGFCLVQHTNFFQGAPCSPPERVPSLVGPDGLFHRSGAHKSGRAVATYEDAKTECIAQMERFKELTGEYPIHVEGHAFFTPDIKRALEDAARAYGVHFMDMDGEPQPGWLPAPEDFERYTGINDSGVEVEDFLADRFSLVERGKTAVQVLHFHPGYIDQYLLDNTSLTLPRCKDLQTLLDPRVRQWLEQAGFELIDYSGLRA